MSDRSDDGIAAVIKLALAGVIFGALSIKGCVTRQGLPSDLPLRVENEVVQEIPATNFHSDGKSPNVIVIKESSNGAGKLKTGLNEVQMSCDTYDSDTYTVDLDGAFGEVKAGTNVDFAGSRDDLSIKRVNGEKVKLSLHCDTGKYSDESVVYLDVSR